MVKWTRESVEQVLSDKGEGCQPQEIQDGVQYRIDDGPIVNLYNTGRVVVQGRQTPLKDELEAIFSGAETVGTAEVVSSPEEALPASSRVFIVHGHDRNVRNQLKLILQDLGLSPIILEEMSRTGDTIIEGLEELTNSDFACVLLTPDDQGHRYGHPDEIKPRARQNVVLEMGMVLAKLGRRRVAIFHKESGLELPSDIAGLLYIPFNNELDEVKDRLARSLRDADLSPNLEGLL